MDNNILGLIAQRRLARARLARMNARIDIARMDESEWIRTTHCLIEFMVLEKSSFTQEIGMLNEKINAYKSGTNKKYKC